MSETGDLKALVLQAQSRFAEVAPKWLSVERLVRLALAARSRSPGLMECTADSFLLFCMRCAETGLEPIGAGGAWAVPFRNKKTGQREVQFIPDWRGLINLGKRTGQIKHAYGDVVCEKDEVDYEKGDAPHLKHRPALRDRSDVIGAYCIVILPDDSKHIEYMNREEVEAIRRRSKAADDGPWVTDWGQMAIKTVVKRALKPFAGSPEMQTAIAYDNEATGLRLLEAGAAAHETAPTKSGAVRGEGRAKTAKEELQEKAAALGIEAQGMTAAQLKEAIEAKEADTSGNSDGAEPRTGSVAESREKLVTECQKAEASVARAANCRKARACIGVDQDFEKAPVAQFPDELLASYHHLLQVQ